MLPAAHLRLKYPHVGGLPAPRQPRLISKSRRVYLHSYAWSKAALYVVTIFCMLTELREAIQSMRGTALA
jgi:hypothetical protein